MLICKFIVIIDPPGRAFLQKDVETVIKGESITLTCVVEELGRPAAEASLPAEVDGAFAVG